MELVNILAKLPLVLLFVPFIFITKGKLQMRILLTQTGFFTVQFICALYVLSN